MQDNKILKEEHSSFLIENQEMPQDALFKLDTLQKNIPLTYLGAVFEGKNQKVVKNEEVDVISYEVIKIDELNSIVIPKNELVSVSGYYQNSGIDYIFSPFSILNEYLQEFGVKNSLNVFILNNIVYTILLGGDKEVVRADTKELTPFEEIKDEEFSDDEIVDQKIYEEVHFLQIQQFLTDIVQEYYSSGDDVEFLEEIKILYTLGPFTDEQLDSLYETLMVKVNYEQIDLQGYLSKIITSENVLNYSFIDPRVKKEKGSSKSWLFLLVLSLVAIATVVYFKMSEPSMEQEKQESATKNKLQEKPFEEKKEITKIEKVIVLPKLPDHIQANNNVKEKLKMLFDVIPYDGVLKDIEVYDKSSTFVVNFAMPSRSVEDIQIKLKNIYKESKVLLKHQNKALINAIIENNNFRSEEKEVLLKEYPKLNFMSISKATDYLTSLVIKNSTIKLEKRVRGKYQTYRYNVVSKITDLNQFFRFIDKLNKQKSAISLSYPILFSKLNDVIELKYSLEFSQGNEKQIKKENTKN